MASNAYRRFEQQVDGSLAYDLDWEVREHELRHAGEAPRHQNAQPQTKQETKSLEDPRKRERQWVSPLAVIGFGVIAAMAILTLMSYIQLTALSNQTVALKSELATLQTENVALKAQYEQIFDLASVKAAAQENGMMKPVESQITYINLSDGDTAQVYQKEEVSVMERLAASLHHRVSAVVEYFA